MRNADVDAMVLAHIRAMKEASLAPVRIKRTRAQAKKRKAKRKAGRKSRRGKRK